MSLLKAGCVGLITAGAILTAFQIPRIFFGPPMIVLSPQKPVRVIHAGQLSNIASQVTGSRSSVSASTPSYLFPPYPYAIYRYPKYPYHTTPYDSHYEYYTTPAYPYYYTTTYKPYYSAYDYYTTAAPYYPGYAYYKTTSKPYYKKPYPMPRYYRTTESPDYHPYYHSTELLTKTGLTTTETISTTTGKAITTTTPTIVKTSHGINYHYHVFYVNQNKHLKTATPLLTPPSTPPPTPTLTPPSTPSSTRTSKPKKQLYAYASKIPLNYTTSISASFSFDNTPAPIANYKPVTANVYIKSLYKPKWVPSLMHFSESRPMVSSVNSHRNIKNLLKSNKTNINV